MLMFYDAKSQKEMEYVIGKTYYINNVAKGYLIWELIGFDKINNLAFLRHPETKQTLTEQLTRLKSTNRIDNHPYYEKKLINKHKIYENKTIKKNKKEIRNN